MLARLVSNSSPCDLPASASQSAGITGVSHCAQPRVTFILHLIQRSTESKAECWRDLLQPWDQHLSPWNDTLDCLAAGQHQVHTGFVHILSPPAARPCAIFLPNSGYLLTREMGMGLEVKNVNLLLDRARRKLTTQK